MFNFFIFIYDLPGEISKLFYEVNIIFLAELMGKFFILIYHHTWVLRGEIKTILSESLCSLKTTPLLCRQLSNGKKEML